MTMKEMEEKLDKGQFLRIHRSFIVSLNHINAFAPERVEVGGKELPIGYSYRNFVLKVLSS